MQDNKSCVFVRRFPIARRQSRIQQQQQDNISYAPSRIQQQPDNISYAPSRIQQQPTPPINRGNTFIRRQQPRQQAQQIQDDARTYSNNIATELIAVFRSLNNKNISPNNITKKSLMTQYPQYIKYFSSHTIGAIKEEFKDYLEHVST